MGQLAGKVALISGSARGQGAAEAQLFVAEDARVMVSDVLEERGRATAAALGDAGAFVPLDVTSESGWERAVAATLERFGRLDILINNAGIRSPGTVESTTLADYQRVINVNQLGVFLGMKAAAPALRVRGGAIVNISSATALRGVAGSFCYSASKWAVRGMTKSAALDLAAFGIRVNSVHASFVDTEMVADVINSPTLPQYLQSVPLGRVGNVDEIATLVLYLASDASAYCTGAEFVIDGGWSAK